MIERMDLRPFADLLDDRRIMPGLGAEQRARVLAGCVWLRDGEQVAVFRPDMFRRYEALVLDVDTPSPFTRDALAFMFREVGADAISFTSETADAGEPYGALCRGAFQTGGGFSWLLEKWR